MEFPKRKAGTFLYYKENYFIKVIKPGVWHVNNNEECADVTGMRYCGAVSAIHGEVGTLQKRGTAHLMFHIFFWKRLQ